MQVSVDRFCGEVQIIFVEYMDFVNKSQGLHSIYAHRHCEQI